MCANCRARGVAGAQYDAQYMIRGAGQGGTRGPMGRDEVIRGIAKGRYGPDDRISAVGGDESPIADHPEFRSAYIPGSELDLRIDSLRAEIAAVQRRAKIARVLNWAAAVLLLVVSIGALWFSSQSRLLVMPEGWMVKVEEQVDWWRNQVEPPPRFRGVAGMADLPHGDWVVANRPAADGTALHDGFSGLWWAEYADLETTRRAFLSAASRSPLDPMPLVGLILVDSQMLHTRPELVGEVARAQTRLDTMKLTGPSISSADGARLLALGQRTGAAQATEPHKDTDLMCALLYAEANSDVAALEEVLVSVGESPRVLRSIANAALASKDWRTLERAGLRLVETSARSPTGHEVLSRFFAAMGDWPSAADAATRALEKGSERADMLHTVAAVSLGSGRPAEASAKLFDDLVEHPHLAGHTNRQTVLIQASQTRVLFGDLAGARELVDAAIEAWERDPKAAVVLADILYKDGQHSDAEAILRGIDTSELDAGSAAMVHLWAARLYLQMNKQRLARSELEEAERRAPDWPRVLEELAWAEVESGDLAGAISAVERMVFLEPFRYRYADPLNEGALLPPRPRRISNPLLTAMEGDVRHEQHRESLAAILAWWRNRPGHYDQLLDAIEEDPDHLALQGAVALAAFAHNDWEQAAEQSLRVIGRRPGLGVMQSIRGRALVRLGRGDEAVDPLKRSSRSDTGRGELMRLAALSYAELEQLELAHELLDEAMVLQPSDTRIARALFDLPIEKK